MPEFKKLFRRKKKQSETVARGVLREFVYLDETSVTSLLSSRLGAIPSEITETLSNARRIDLNAGVDLPIPAAKPKLGGRFETTRTEGSQVLRKASVQATFKDFYDGELSSLVLQPPSGMEGEIDSDTILRALRDNEEIPRRLLGAPSLVRGSLAEVEVELEADPIFRVSAILSAFADIFQSSERLASQIDQQELRTATEFNQILEQLMFGLIPLRCRLLDYVAVQTGARHHLLHVSALEQIPADQRPSAKPAYLVGVAEQGLFWKDIRQVLFSKARVKIFCRLNQDGIGISWIPVKLGDVLGDISPLFSDEMASFGAGLLRAMAEGGGGQDEGLRQRCAALLRYAELIASKYGHDLSSTDRSDVEVIAEENAGRITTIPESREAFGAVAQFLQERFGWTIEPQEAARLRATARDECGIPEGGNLAPSPPVRQPLARETERAGYLDTEIIAIYW